MHEWRTTSFAFAVRTYAPLGLEIIIHVRIRSVQLFVLIKCLSAALHSLLTLSPVFNDWICYLLLVWLLFRSFFLLVIFCIICLEIYSTWWSRNTWRFYICHQYVYHWDLQVKGNSTEARGLDSTILFLFFSSKHCGGGHDCLALRNLWRIQHTTCVLRVHSTHIPFKIILSDK